jgi:FkbM family methyltransferase
MLISYTALKRIPNYVRRFGFVEGLQLLLKIEKNLPVRSNLKKKYRINCLNQDIYLRPDRGDHSMFWQCVVLNQYDLAHFPQTDRLLETYHSMISVGKKVLIIDCGANIGLASLYFAKVFKEALIVAIEPDPLNFEMLKLNTASLGERITYINGAIWGDSSNLKIANPASGSASFRVNSIDEKDDADSYISGYTINQICEVVGIDSPFIVKLDIEGSQKQLFSSNTEWVGGSHLITLELDDWLLPWAGTSRPFFKVMSKYPFDYLLGGESIYCFQDHDSQESDVD